MAFLFLYYYIGNKIAKEMCGLLAHICSRGFSKCRALANASRPTFKVKFLVYLISQCRANGAGKPNYFVNQMSAFKNNIYIK